MAQGEPRGAVVRALPFHGDDAALALALRGGHAGALAAVFERYGPYVQRVLARVLGTDPDLPDLIQDVFVQAIEGIGRLENPAAIRGWLATIAVRTARARIRRRSLRAWPRASDPAELPDVEATTPSEEVRDALRRVYAVLERFPAELRIVFGLRFVDGMELVEMAGACGCSLATVKRRIVKAQARFQRAVERDAVLKEWLEGGGS